MQLNQLFNFMEAVKYRSISVAAERNYISQSSFSSSISRLEKELGVSLLKRTNYGITVTDYGYYVLEQAKLIFEARDNIIAASGSDSLYGTVSISSIPGIISRILPEAIKEVHADSPNLFLQVNTGESRLIARDVSSGHAGLGIVIRGDYLNSFKDLQFTPLFQDEYHLYVGRDSPLWEQTSVTLEEVKKQNYITYRDEFRKENGGLPDLFIKKDYPKPSLCCDDPDFIKKMISLSDHIAFFPKYMEENDYYLEKGLIKAIPVSDYDLAFEVGYIESTIYRMSVREKKVLETVKATVNRLLSGKQEIS